MAKRPATSSPTKDTARRAAKAPPTEALPPAAPSHPAPIPFSRIIGHDHALSLLANAIRAKKVHHAWVFHGPLGVGKFTAALAFAALLLDPTTGLGLSGEIDADPGSPTRRLLNAGTHPDLHIIRKELALYHDDPQVRSKKLTNIPVDVLRQFMLAPGVLGASIRTSALASRVFIVDEAELLAVAGQNALLKFLEEPPPGVVVILVTSSEERLLPTIRSRCQRVAFAALSPADLERWANGAGIEASGAERAWLIRLAEGSPGVMLHAHRAGLFGWAQRLGPWLDDASRGKFSVPLGPAMHQLVEEFAEAAVKDQDNASKDAANKAGADWMLRLLASHWRGVLRSAPAPGPTLARLDAIRLAEAEIDANVNLQFVFEKLSAEFAAAE